MKQREAQKDPQTIAERPADFVYLDVVDPSLIVDCRYAGSHNFVGRPIPGYASGRIMLTRAAADALLAVQALARARGLTLKVYDGYRPQRASDAFFAWAQDVRDEKMKREFYPDLAKKDIFPRGYVMQRSGHSRGSTVDVTLVKLPAVADAPYVDGAPLLSSTAPYGERWGDNGIDMGTGFDSFDARAHTDHPAVVGVARQNRQLLKQLMESCGFENYPKEWWHFTLRDEPYSHSYFDFVP